MNKIFVWASILCLTALVSIPLSAQNVKTKGLKGSASARDMNIHSENMVNSMDHPAPQPMKSRGLNGTCNIHVANETGYYVQFYFNGNPAGAVGPWGSLNPNITEGNAALYARAVFTNGAVLTFGPRDLTCTGTDFTWTLTP